MPDTRELYKRYRRKGLEILGISLDETIKNAKKAVKNLKLPWRHLFDGGSNMEGPFTKPFMVNGIPDSVLFDRNGRVRAMGLRGVKLEEAIKKLLKEKVPKRRS